MIERQSDQGSQNWQLDRLGFATASRFADIQAISKKDGKPLKAREDYLMELVVARLTQTPAETIKSYAMTWGTESEAFARAEYEAQTGAIVREVGFIKHADIPWVGASSDGLVGEYGAIEIKCPFNSAVHLKTIRDGMPGDHMAQVQGQMWVLGLSWVDFISYDPRLPPALRLHVQRIERDEKYIKDLEADVLLFLLELEKQVESFLNPKD